MKTEFPARGGSVFFSRTLPVRAYLYLRFHRLIADIRTGEMRMKPNNRITYRFDRDGRPISEGEDKQRLSSTMEIKQSQSNKAYPYLQPAVTKAIDEIHPWDNVFQEEDFTDADHNDDAVYRRSSGGSSWFNVLLSVAGALATGALFGYLILSLFTGGFIWPGSAENDNRHGIGDKGKADTQGISLDEITSLPLTESANQKGNHANGIMSEGEAASGALTAASAVKLRAEKQVFTLLQFGVFSGTAGRDDALKQLADKGLPRAAARTGDSYRVYAGIAVDYAQAETLASQLQDLLIYKKEFVLQTPEKLLFNGSKEEAGLFFELTAELVSTWSTLVVAELEQPSLTPIGQTASKAWKDMYMAWGESAEAMKKGVTDDKGRNYLSQLTQSIGLAAESLYAYDKAAAKTNLWTTQTALMEAVLVQKEWFGSTTAL